MAGCLTLLLVACSSASRNNGYSSVGPYISSPKPSSSGKTYQAPLQNISINNTVNMSSSKQQGVMQGTRSHSSTLTLAQSPVHATAFERLSYEDLVRFEPDCERGTEQIALLEEQLRRNRFYTVNGIEGNAYPGKISKSYYSLAKYRIWSLRFSCQASAVDYEVIKADLQAYPNLPPATTPRCYFEETAEVKTGVQQTNYLASDHKSSRKEICSNFPYVEEKPFIRVGDQMTLSSRQLVSGVSNSALRKWKGNVYQIVSKTEMHMNQAVRFSLVVVRSGINQWTVIDKF